MKLQAIAAAAALAVVSPAIALAAGNAPVAIVSSHIQPASVGSELPEPGSVQLSFVNQSRVPATEVDFAFTSYGEIVGTYRDVGSFAQGVTIDRSFGTALSAPNERVAVAAVKYADGTVWSNDNAPAAARRQADVSLFTK